MWILLYMPTSCCDITYRVNPDVEDAVARREKLTLLADFCRVLLPSTKKGKRMTKRGIGVRPSAVNCCTRKPLLPFIVCQEIIPVAVHLLLRFCYSHHFSKICLSFQYFKIPVGDKLLHKFLNEWRNKQEVPDVDAVYLPMNGTEIMYRAAPGKRMKLWMAMAMATLHP